MTLMPVEERRLRFKGITGVPSGQAQVCAVPSCTNRAQEPHHIVPRRATAGPRDFVEIDGQVVENVAWLCHYHHHMVTSPIGGHGAKVRWINDEGWMWYELFQDKWVRRGVLLLGRTER